MRCVFPCRAPYAEQMGESACNAYCELDASLLALIVIRWRYAPHQTSSLSPSPYLINAAQFDNLSPVFTQVVKHAVLSTVDDIVDELKQSDRLAFVADIIAVAIEQYHPACEDFLTQVATALLSLFTTTLQESDPRLVERALLAPFI
jgi:hypothetical protein